MTLHPEQVGALMSDPDVFAAATAVVTSGLGDVHLGEGAWGMLDGRDGDWLTACLLVVAGFAVAGVRLGADSLGVDPLVFVQDVAVRRATDG